MLQISHSCSVTIYILSEALFQQNYAANCLKITINAYTKSILNHGIRCTPVEKNRCETYPRLGTRRGHLQGNKLKLLVKDNFKNSKSRATSFNLEAWVLKRDVSLSNIIQIRFVHFKDVYRGWSLGILAVQMNNEGRYCIFLMNKPT